MIVCKRCNKACISRQVSQVHSVSQPQSIIHHKVKHIYQSDNVLGMCSQNVGFNIHEHVSTENVAATHLLPQATLNHANNVLHFMVCIHLLCMQQNHFLSHSQDCPLLVLHCASSPDRAVLWLPPVSDERQIVMLLGTPEVFHEIYGFALYSGHFTLDHFHCEAVDGS